MDHDMHDDGLVHSHGWAADKAGPALAPRMGMTQAAEVAAAMGAHPQDAHDDGLVHGHGWACSERGQMAAR